MCTNAVLGRPGGVKYDLIIFGGGEILQSNHIFPLALYIWKIYISKYQPNSIVALFGVGCTRKFSCLDKRRISKFMRIVDYIYVRDKLSKDNISSLFKRESTIIPDVVYINALNKNSKKGIKLYGITSFTRIKKYGLLASSKEQYFEFAHKEISGINGKVTLFYTTYEDYNSCVEFTNYIENKYKQHYAIAQVSNLQDLESYLSQCKSLYSPRMHGCILATLHNITVHPIIISPKMASFKDRYLPNPNLQQLKSELISAAKDLISKIN